MPDLSSCRVQIDRIDKALLKLLKERLDVAAEIAACKMDSGKAIVDKEREQHKLNQFAREAAAAGVPAATAVKIMRAIMDETVSYEEGYLLQQHNGGRLTRPVSIAYLGPGAGTYSHLAAIRFLEDFSGDKQFIDCMSFDEVIAQVESGRSEYAILPIENSSSGNINDVMDILQRTRCSIVGEVFYRIEHSVLAVQKVEASAIKTVYSHPQPIAQCSFWLKENLPQAKTVCCESTSAAMRLVSQMQDPSAVAIACQDSASLYNLTPLFSDLANNKRNYTRFIVLSLTPVKVPLNLPAKTSLLFTTHKYKPGSLIKVLNAFSSRSINMTKLQSRPREDVHRETWEEIFFVELEGNIDAPVMQEVIAQIQDVTGYCKILGCYPSQEKHPA